MNVLSAVHFQVSDSSLESSDSSRFYTWNPSLYLCVKLLSIALLSKHRWASFINSRRLAGREFWPNNGRVSSSLLSIRCFQNRVIVVLTFSSSRYRGLDRFPKLLESYQCFICAGCRWVVSRTTVFCVNTFSHGREISPRYRNGLLSPRLMRN